MLNVVALHYAVDMTQDSILMLYRVHNKSHLAGSAIGRVRVAVPAHAFAYKRQRNGSRRAATPTRFLSAVLGSGLTGFSSAATVFPGFSR